MYHYVGEQSFILDDSAHVEQHHFVQTSKQYAVQRLLWFLFEGFLDTNHNRYRYDRLSERLILREFDFFHDADSFNWDVDHRKRPNSDSAHVVDFLRTKGFRLGGDTIFKRLVWLDQHKRNELMIIYSEDLGLTGYRVADLRTEGFAVTKWPDLALAFHDRALASFSIV